MKDRNLNTHIRKGIGLFSMLSIAILTYVGSAVLFIYLLDKYTPPSEVEKNVNLDSLASFYLLNLDSLRNNKDFMAGIKKRITDEEIEDAVSLVEDSTILSEIGVNIPGIEFQITDSLRTNYAMKDLVENELLEYINENKATLELKKEKVELQRKLEKLKSKLDTTRTKSVALEKNLASKEGEIKRLETEKEEEVKNRTELNTKELSSLANKYNSMKPRKAAQILMGMNEGDVVRILKKMKNRQAAKVMTELPPVKASKLSMMMINGV
ncbi:MAG: hypothetical protein CR982_04680 [Candidatus Cloacimonadota bacterium]|nr:MAG: hypothetical protein CR982_04680 [Candidatus Cloacimonadota bacterium]PIE77975.1 MAG: hypothetical protein CSA15_10245 [Candidatus Delongbacteria bacterium]